MAPMIRRALQWLFVLALGMILFLPKDFMDQSNQMLLASGWLGNSVAVPGSPHPPA
jgi:hypothetical protein